MTGAKRPSKRVTKDEDASSSISAKITALEGFKALLREWGHRHDDDLRSRINQQKMSIRREVIEAGCFGTLTIGPPPAVGGLIMRDVDPFAVMFDPPYRFSVIPTVVDMIDQAIGVLRSPHSTGPATQFQAEAEITIQLGYVFVAMPINENDETLNDVLDAIKEAAARCGLQAERIDEPQSNERITDRILESIGKAEYVIVDLTNSRPNVFYEAGYAHGLGKIPIYIAREGTHLEFDLKDYPVIFFGGFRQLKDRLEARLRALGKPRH